METITLTSAQTFGLVLRALLSNFVESLPGLEGRHDAKIGYNNTAKGGKDKRGMKNSCIASYLNPLECLHGFRLFLTEDVPHVDGRGGLQPALALYPHDQHRLG
jgi:hypothetical protein